MSAPRMPGDERDARDVIEVLDRAHERAQRALRAVERARAAYGGDTLIDLVLARIADNNQVPGNDWLAGRREAYEDVLRLLGYYNDQDEVIVR